jgi:hypothetical protein
MMQDADELQPIADALAAEVANWRLRKQLCIERANDSVGQVEARWRGKAAAFEECADAVSRITGLSGARKE